MTNPFKEMRNLGSLILGAILLVIGLVATFYERTRWSDYYYRNEPTGQYPYQTVGIVLILAGIVFVGLGLFYSQRKTAN